MDLHLKDKVIIVTGGGAGIGGAISLNLASEGAIVAIICRSALNDDFVEKLKKNGARYWFGQSDLMDEQACANNVQEIVTRFGRIDGLVNNAGVNDNIGISDIDS